ALELFNEAGAIKALMPELLKMKKCVQPKNYHREGDVWEHTKLCLKETMDKNFAKEFGEKANAEVIIATLFHDIAKPLTMTKEKGRIRYLGHSELGADLAKKIAERLKLSSFKDENIDVDPDRLHALVYYHLLLLSSDPREMRATTIERHYLRHELLGREMLMVQYADGAGTIDSKKQKSLGPYRLMKRRIHELLGTRAKKLPVPLLNGNEIMRLLKIKPGPAVGQIITELREAQLQKKVTTKQAARDFIKTLKL
ncbi:MAG: HDIG domain-containing protein, partial [bacterium]|nr:HDIG domain-containing protein [bacterium]